MIRPSESRRSGFTLVEVMIAIGIMTVGSLGILSMHQALGQANRAALEMNTALAITERWVERIERDSLTWTEEGPASASLTATTHLSPLAATATQTDWFRPAPVVDGESYGADHFGNDIEGAEAAKFCTNIRLSWIRVGNSARVDIRTYWYREGHVLGAATHPDWVAGDDFRNSDCDANDADGWGLSDDVVPNIDVVHASTVVRWLRREGT